MKKNVLNVIGAAVLTLLMPLNNKAQVGAAINFDGTDDRVNLGTALNATFAPLNKVTVEAWVKPTNLTGLGIIVGNYAAPLAQITFLLRREVTFYSFFIGNGGGGNFLQVNSATAPTVGVWQHVAGTYDGTVASIYVNGALSATAAISYTFGAATNSFVIGGIGGEHFNGEIDEVRIWNVTRTKCQINTYKDCEIPTTGTGLISNYHFNQGVAAAANPTVTTLTDASGNALTGTLTNLALTGATSNWITPGGVVSGFTTALASPTLSVTSSQSTAACPGTTANLTAAGGTNYVWVAPLTSTVAVANITLQVTSPTYSVNGTATTGCAATGTFMQLVTANPATIVSMPVSTIMCTGESKTLTATAGASTYAWQSPLTSTTAVAVISPTAAGNFTYSVLSTGSVCPGYTWTSVFTQSVSGCVGIQNASSQNVSFGVYPNPTAGEFTIELNNGTTKTVEVIDFTGRVILTNTSSADKINMNLSALAKGIYYVRVQSNNTVEIAKLIKE